MTITAIREWLRDYWVVLLVGLGVAGYFGWQWVTPPRADLTVTTSSQSLAASASTSSSHAQAGYVYIQGAVAHPGLYPVTGQTRWEAVVQAAGGVTKQADTSGLNLAKIANDEESLYVPTKGETPAPAATTGAATTATSDGTPVINLNTATAADLEGLSGIGPKRAADIVAYRDAHGGFKTVEELKEVSGIGEKIFASLAPDVTVGP